jgi:hypothetical protein
MLGLFEGAVTGAAGGYGRMRKSQPPRYCTWVQDWQVGSPISTMHAAPERHSSPRDPARDTASVRVLTASFEKIRLACDFTVSGEISRVRAIRLLVKP